MNDEEQQATPQPQPSSFAKKCFLTCLVFLVLLGAGAIYYLWRYPKPSTNHAIKTLRQHHQQHAEHLEALQDKVQALQTRTRPHSSFSALMDAKQTLLLADYQLRFNLNSTSAIQLLRFANQQLDVQHRPALKKVQAAIQTNIALIKQHPIPEASNTIDQINAIKKSIAAWQPNAKIHHDTHGKKPEPKVPPHPDKGRWATVWEQIKIALHNMVIVSYTEAPAPYPTLHHMQLDQDESLFLLSQAQWAIMNHDIASFRSAMQTTIQHLHRSFPKRNATIHAIITHCQKLLESYAHLDQLNVQKSMAALTKAFGTIGSPTPRPLKKNAATGDRPKKVKPS